MAEHSRDCSGNTFFEARKKRLQRKARIQLIGKVSIADAPMPSYLCKCINF